MIKYEEKWIVLDCRDIPALEWDELCYKMYNFLTENKIKHNNCGRDLRNSRYHHSFFIMFEDPLDVLLVKLNF